MKTEFINLNGKDTTNYEKITSLKNRHIKEVQIQNILKNDPTVLEVHKAINELVYIDVERGQKLDKNDLDESIILDGQRIRPSGSIRVMY